MVEMFVHNNQTFKVISANKKHISSVKNLCDETLGKNFYSTEDLLEIFENKNSWFYMLFNGDDEFIGFHYHYIEPLINVSEQFKCCYEEMVSASGEKAQSNVGVLKSIAIDRKFRGNGIAFVFSNYAIDNLFEQGVCSIWVPAWKQNEYVPENNTLLKQGFTHHCDVKKLWYGKENLCCPICKQERCICDAAIYYRIRCEKPELAAL